jgi:hypothetical protein
MFRKSKERSHFILCVSSFSIVSSIARFPLELQKYLHNVLLVCTWYSRYLPYIFTLKVLSIGMHLAEAVLLIARVRAGGGGGRMVLAIQVFSAGILEQSKGARNRVGIGLSYRPAPGYIGLRACTSTTTRYQRGSYKSQCRLF